jgi:translation initiation factor IF-2
MESKDLLDLCHQAGFDVKNQLSSLDPEQRDQVVAMVRKGGGGVATAAPPKPVAHVLPDAHKPIRVLQGRPQALPPRVPRKEPEPAPAAVIPPPTPAPDVPETPAAEAPAPPTPPRAPSEPPATPAHAPAAKAPDKAPPPKTTPPAAAPVGPPVIAARDTGKPPDLGGKVPAIDTGKPRDVSAPRPPEPTARPQIVRKREIPRPAAHRLASPPPLKQKPIELKKAAEPKQTPIMYIPPEMAKGGGPINVKDVKDLLGGVKPGVGVTAPVEIEDDEESGKVRPGGVAGRDQRHAKRNERARIRKERQPEAQVVGGKLVITDELDRPVRTTSTKERLRQAQKKLRAPTQPRKGKVPVEAPITVRALSEALGIQKGPLLFKLVGLGLPSSVNINSIIEPTMAESIAVEHGCELEIKRPADAEKQLLAESQKDDNPEDLHPRAPIVTIMGHVDHGKTSLLDKIRKSNIVATEAGGITQVIRAWRVEHGGKPITFLDTPGHEAFTKMRARGANVTDIAVIVVGADDGVMPQTEEAINHAKAAGVSMVVAINKVDLPNANVNRTRQQLYGLGVLPDNMGGDVPFVETSAVTGKGIFEPNGLLDMISVVAELKELKANPNKPASGTCLEAMLNEGEGVFATLLIQRGTLRRGDSVLCGGSFGRVRALYDDQGRPIAEAGPSTPVRITGLDEVPDADDSFQVVTDLTVAREIAERRQYQKQESTAFRREPVKLETLTQTKIAELKVILKADFRGSIEAIRKELEKLVHEEVRVRILEAAIGGITENDVWLALTSPDDTIIVGFNVVPDDRAKSLAEEKGVQIRQYNIIYNLTDDIRSALEGKLKPREEVVHLGRAVVRETFKISRVGTVAGCFVTQGIIERSAKVRVIREGVVVYPPADKTIGLESLRRIKEDVREVRSGFDCGIKIAGYDDVKVGDVIEAYRIEQIQRTLS